jgi:hypothetical protein
VVILKKILLLCFLPLLFLVGCSRFDLTDYHSEGETWNYALENVEYTFKYNVRSSDGVYIKVTRDTEFIRNNSSDDKIYIYSKSDTFDYVMVNENKIDEDVINSVVLIGVYNVGDNNSAEFFIHSSLKKFDGFVKAEVYSQPTTSDSMQIIRITLH